MTIEEFTKQGYDHTTYKHRSLLVDILKQHQPFDSLLDVGCGNGTDLVLIHHALPKVELTGFDVSPENIQEADSRGLPATLYQADLQAKLKEIPNKSFDIVFTNGVMMYNPKEFLRELPRIARKAIILSEHDPDQNMLNYIENEMERPVKVTKVTEDIRSSWVNKGYIYEIII